MKKLLILVGTRPNFIKVTQFKKHAADFNLECKIVHTGQHFDKNMSAVFFDQFDLQPDYFLDIPQNTAANQMGNIMICLEALMKKTYTPDLLIVPGDVNSTLAGALTANKMNIPLAHLESGLRSFDRTMPEEINRILTDQLADYCFVTEPSGMKNIQKEKLAAKSYHVGNTMIDTMVAYEEQIQSSDILQRLNVAPQKYFLMTMHRPANVDDKSGLEKLSNLLKHIDQRVVFPMHPRTKQSIADHQLTEQFEALNHVLYIDPIGYFEFQKLISQASAIITDSGGIQEETTYRQIPCLTLRNNTERPVTTESGSNKLLLFDEKEILEQLHKIQEGAFKKGEVPKYWDGKATARIVHILSEIFR